MVAWATGVLENCLETIGEILEGPATADCRADCGIVEELIACRVWLTASLPKRDARDASIVISVVSKVWQFGRSINTLVKTCTLHITLPHFWFSDRYETRRRTLAPQSRAFLPSWGMGVVWGMLGVHSLGCDYRTIELIFYGPSPRRINTTSQFLYIYCHGTISSPEFLGINAPNVFDLHLWVSVRLERTIVQLD